MPAAIPIVGGVIAAGGAIAGGALAASGAKSAARESRKAADAAAEAQLEMFYQSREDQAPWREAGMRALEELEREIAAGPGAFEQSPYYQTLMGSIDMMTESAARQGAASGVGGGAVQRSLLEPSMNLAGQMRANWLNEWLARRLNPLQSLSGLGQTAAGQIAQNAIDTGRTLAGVYSSLGNQLASAYGARLNALSQGVLGAANAVNTALGNYYNYQLTNSLLDKLG